MPNSREYSQEYYRNNKDRWKLYQQRPGDKERRRAAARSRYAAMKSAIATWKLELGCMDCGYNKIPDALEFDHIADDKIANVGNLGQNAIETVIAEIEKCDVVCANCHRERTAARRSEA